MFGGLSVHVALLLGAPPLLLGAPPLLLLEPALPDAPALPAVLRLPGAPDTELGESPANEPLLGPVLAPAEPGSESATPPLSHDDNSNALSTN